MVRAKRQKTQRTARKTKHAFSFFESMGWGVLAFVSGTLLILFFLLAIVSLSHPARENGNVAGVETPVYPDTFTEHWQYRGIDGEYQTRNLITEDGSFRVGIGDRLDGISVARVMMYDHYNPGSGDMFSLDTAKGFVPWEVVTNDGVDDTRSLKIDNRNADGAYLDLNWVRAPTTGRYVFSFWVKITNLGGVVDDDTTCNNDRSLIHMALVDREYNTFYSDGDIGDRWIYPGNGWTRVSTVTSDVNLLQAGELYRPEIKIASTAQPLCLGKATFAFDGFQLEYAADQENPAASTYIYPTEQQELFAYSSADALGATPKHGNLYFNEDNETIFAHVQIHEQANLPTSGSPAELRWELYDIDGNSQDAGTALATGTLPVQHAAGNLQTLHLDLSNVLGGLSSGKTKGLLKMNWSLWDSTGTTMIDKEFLVLGRLERSPYVGMERPDSFFGNHVSRIGYNGNYNRFFNEVNRSPEELLILAENMGIKASREFALLNQQNIEGGLDDDPFWDDYVNATAAHHISLLPVLPKGLAGNNANQQWQDFVTTAMNHYGTKIQNYEVLNEPSQDSFPYQQYYAFLWRAFAASRAQTIPPAIIGPSANLTYLENLLGYTDGTHATGYNLFDRFAGHVYFPYVDGLRNVPENGAGTPYNGVEDLFQQFFALVDSFGPGGVNTKPTWVTEFGINSPRLYDDIPVVYGGLWGEPIALREHMSGSVPVARKVAADYIRQHLYQMVNNLEKTFAFGLTATRMIDGGLFTLFDHDGTPFGGAVPLAELTRLLDGADFVRRVEYPQLRSNGVLQTSNRAFVFEAPDLANPGATRAVAAVFNYDQDATGASLLNVPISTTDVEVHDIEGNTITLPPGSSFSLPLDPAPKYLIGKNGMTAAEMVLALDAFRPNPPSKPSVSIVSNQVKVSWQRQLDTDVSRYKVSRYDENGANPQLLGIVTATTGITASYTDTPSTGLWRYGVTALEDGSDYETASSPLSQTISLNLAPILLPVGDLELHEDDVLEIGLTASDQDLSDTLVFSAMELPDGATLVDHHDRTATLSWRPTTSQAGVYDDLRLAVSDGDAEDEEIITITVHDGISGCTPNWSCSDWSACVDSVRTRTCTDANACGSDVDRPETSQACDATSPEAVEDLREL